MKKKNKTPSYILTLSLMCQPHEIDVLNKRFSIAERMYNQTLTKAKTNLFELKRNKRYKRLLRDLAIVKKLEKEDLKVHQTSVYTKDKKMLNEQLKELKSKYGVSEYWLHSYIKKQQNQYKQHIDSLTAQKIASTVWKAVSSNLYKDGRKLHYKKRGQLTSLEGKNNKSGLRFKDNWLVWNELMLKVNVRETDLYAKEALSTSRVKYCRLVRKVIKGKLKFCVQLVLEGTPPPKRLKNGSFKRKSSPNERVGLDIGPSSLAVVSKEECLLTELAEGLDSYDKEKRRLLRKLDRSRRLANPDNYNTDGTVKRGVKLTWIRSKNYMRTLFKYKDIERRRAIHRKQSHEKLANDILSLGNEVYVETMRWKSLQKRSSKTETSEKTGKFKRKKRFGKSISNHGPSAFMDVLERKLNYQGKNLNKVNTTTFKASQFNHTTGDYIKKDLSERWNLINGEKIQRDLYSAFLIMNAQDDLRHTDINLCIKTYETFKRNHQKCLKQMKQTTNKKRLKSFGF